MENTTINDIRLSPHFRLGEFYQSEQIPRHYVRLGYYK